MTRGRKKQMPPMGERRIDVGKLILKFGSIPARSGTCWYSNAFEWILYDEENHAVVQRVPQGIVKLVCIKSSPWL